MNFKQEVEQYFSILTPLIDKACNANRIFREEFAKGSRIEGFERYKQSELYQKTLAQFRKTHEAVYGQIEPVLDQVVGGDYSEMEKIFAFLKTKKGLHRGGYLKEKICQKIKRLPFTEEQKAVLQEIVLAQMETAGREFRGYVSLIPAIFSIEFKKKIQEYDDKGIEYIHKRKKQMLAFLALHCPDISLP